jgi:hypothetical protein
MTNPKFKSPEFDYPAIAKDYNALNVEETIAFLATSATSADRLRSGLSRRGLRPNQDYRVFQIPVLSPKSFSMISGFPMEEIIESEFTDYACLAGNLYPDPDNHPAVFAADKAIPRRSNRHLTIDSLPVFNHIYQVYIVKLSTNLLVNMKKRGKHSVDK